MGAMCLFGGRGRLTVCQVAFERMVRRRSETGSPAKSSSIDSRASKKQDSSISNWLW